VRVERLNKKEGIRKAFRLLSEKRGGEFGQLGVALLGRKLELEMRAVQGRNVAPNRGEERNVKRLQQEKGVLQKSGLPPKIFEKGWQGQERGNSEMNL